MTLPTDLVWSIGVVIEGKAPIWLYSYLVHECHAAVWVACFDPRLWGWHSQLWRSSGGGNPLAPGFDRPGDCGDAG